MSEHLSLIEFIRELLTSSDLQDQFTADPGRALDAVGLAHIDAADVHDALTLVNDDSRHADFSRHYDTGWNGVSASALAVAPAPTPHVHESAAEYVHRYVTNTHVEDRDTVVDHSVSQRVDTHGGDFDQDIDVHSTTASGAGAVVASRGIDGSTVTTGHDDQVGNGNLRGAGDVVGDGNDAATGSHGTSAFGQGNASGSEVSGDLHVGDGAAFASGARATVDNSDNSMHDVGNTPTDESVHDAHNDQSDHSVSHSDNSETDTSTNHSGNTDTHTELDNVGNDQTDNSVHMHVH